MCVCPLGEGAHHWAVPFLCAFKGGIIGLFLSKRLSIGLSMFSIPLNGSEYCPLFPPLSFTLVKVVEHRPVFDPF